LDAACVIGDRPEERVREQRLVVDASLALDDLWLRDGAVVRWAHAGASGQTLVVDTLRTAGAATLRVEGSGALPVRVPVVSYASGEGLGGTVWTVVGGKANSRVEVNAARQTLDLVTPKGSLVCVR
jgi:hypothetical protein